MNDDSNEPQEAFDPFYIPPDLNRRAKKNEPPEDSAVSEAAQDEAEPS